MNETNKIESNTHDVAMNIHQSKTCICYGPGRKYRDHILLLLSYQQDKTKPTGPLLTLVKQIQTDWPLTIVLAEQVKTDWSLTLVLAEQLQTDWSSTLAPTEQVKTDWPLICP